MRSQARSSHQNFDNPRSLPLVLLRQVLLQRLRQRHHQPDDAGLENALRELRRREGEEHHRKVRSLPTLLRAEVDRALPLLSQVLHQLLRSIVQAHVQMELLPAYHSIVSIPLLGFNLKIEAKKTQIRANNFVTF